jgi:hypothetical protein
VILKYCEKVLHSCVTFLYSSVEFLNYYVRILCDCVYFLYSCIELPGS